MSRTPIIEATSSLQHLSILDESAEFDASLAPELSDEMLLRMHRAMLLARRLDEEVLSLQRQGRTRRDENSHDELTGGTFTLTNIGAIGGDRFLPLSLSFDHRMIDGAEAARFMARLRERLSSSDQFLTPAEPARREAFHGPSSRQV